MDLNISERGTHADDSSLGILAEFCAGRGSGGVESEGCSKLEARAAFAHAAW